MGDTLPDGSPMPKTLGGLTLVAHSVFSNHVNGLAIYVNTDRWDIKHVSSKPLPPTRTHYKTPRRNCPFATYHDTKVIRIYSRINHTLPNSFTHQ